MSSMEPDWDASTENRYEEHRAHRQSDLCEVCRNDVVAEGGDLCPACIEEIKDVWTQIAREVEAA